jgi:hypothetical protein
MSPADPDVEVAGALLALAHEELGMVEEGRHEDLAAVDDRRAALMEQLPAHPSPAARATLLEVVEAQRQLAVALQLGMARVRDQLGRVSHGRTAMTGYTPAGLDARPVLDQTA